MLRLAESLRAGGDSFQVSDTVERRSNHKTGSACPSRFVRAPRSTLSAFARTQLDIHSARVSFIFEKSGWQRQDAGGEIRPWQKAARRLRAHRTLPNADNAIGVRGCSRPHRSAHETAKCTRSRPLTCRPTYGSDRQDVELKKSTSG